LENNTNILSELVKFTNKGLYCPEADIYVDPGKAVERAVITHAHSDHARYGHKHYLAHKISVPLLKHRLGAKITIQGLEYGEELTHKGVKISLHPAGHIPGSAQVRFEHNGKVAVVSGDYKLENDGLTPPFEPVKCNTFVTESTFAQPVYKWKPQSEIFNDINNWWKQNKAEGITSVIFGYPLGKAQRLLFNVDRSIGKVFVNDTVFSINKILNESGFSLPETVIASHESNTEMPKGSLIIAPSSVRKTPLMKKLGEFSTANASGWMATGAMGWGTKADKGFALSDHADWDGLCEAVRLTGAENILVTHGFSRTFVVWLRKNGFNADLLDNRPSNPNQLEFEF
jgi:putative mRNA 3-end processing factor